MPRTTSFRRYGKGAARTRAEELFAELPKSPEKKTADISIDFLTDQLGLVSLDDRVKKDEALQEVVLDESETEDSDSWAPDGSSGAQSSDISYDGLRILTWDDVCPFGSRIVKIAEASYAEVYRISNDRGTSIIKVIRLESPIKPQTKAQERSGLVDEEPHCEDDLAGEIKISEWLADIPGFVVYKERYIVRGKAPKSLLETHQTFQRRVKRQDPDRLQFYPSPSRYLDDTRFLVVELGDAGTALEDFHLESIDQLWDIFFHTAIALARAEDLVNFEVGMLILPIVIPWSRANPMTVQHRDLHEGNLCIRHPGKSLPRPEKTSCQFGYSGLDITILDYGLSRAEGGDDEVGQDEPTPVAYDLEKDLNIFTSTHASQCKVYRQMRSFLLEGDRTCLPPKAHTRPYDSGVDGPISWTGYYPYTNVLWLAYLYQYLTGNFRGESRDLSQFKRTTKEFWCHLNPDASRDILSFSRAGDVVTYAVEAGWIREAQLAGDHFDSTDAGGYNESIIEASILEDDSHLRRSPRRRKPRMLD
jgi:serine/threonine-protein kinase haspin